MTDIARITFQRYSFNEVLIPEYLFLHSVSIQIVKKPLVDIGKVYKSSQKTFLDPATSVACITGSTFVQHIAKNNLIRGFQHLNGSDLQNGIIIEIGTPHRKLNFGDTSVKVP